MKTSSGWNFRSMAGKIMMGLVLAAMVGSIDVVPALGKDNNQRRDNDRYEQRGRGHDRGRHAPLNRRVYRPYGYREPVYVPPRVIYSPPPPPGISIFFPPIFIHP
jgi:hypothetical protein